MHNSKGQSTNVVESINVTRINWALSTALNDLIDDDASSFRKKPNSEKLVQGLNDFKSLFDGFDSGICYIAKTTKCTDTESDTEETDTRLSGRVRKEVEINTNWFSSKDSFESSLYYNVKDSDDSVDFRSDRQDCGLNSVPEDVIFFYLNMPKLKGIIKTLIDTKSKIYKVDFGNRGSITNNMKLKVYFGPVKWVNSHHFKWKRFVLNISFCYVSEDKVGGIKIEAEESKEIEVKDKSQLNLEANLKEMFKAAEELQNREMELTRGSKGLGE